jgi:guanylate kinase
MPELELAVSATTRERRENEIDGVHYYFISPEEFEQRVQAGAFLEWVDLPWGARSGTLRSELERIARAGRYAVLDVETEGAARIARRIPGSVTIFVRAPDFAELERRLRERATESAGEIDVRLAVAREQLAAEDEFDHVIVNDDLDRAREELTAIVRRELAAVGTIPGR